MFLENLLHKVQTGRMFKANEINKQLLPEFNLYEKYADKIETTIVSGTKMKYSIN